MSDTTLMQELRRLTDVDWIRNELSAPIGMLNMLALEEGEQSAQTVLANDQEAREIILKPFKAFTENTGVPWIHKCMVEHIVQTKC